MEESFIKHRKRQRNLVFCFLIILMAGFFVFLWQRFMMTPPIPVPEITRMPAIKINLDVLESPLLQEFQLFEEILPFEEEVGRDNPFLPY